MIIISSNGFVVTKILITTNKHKDMRDAKLPGAINGQYPVPNPEAINLERVNLCQIHFLAQSNEASVVVDGKYSHPTQP